MVPVTNLSEDQQPGRDEQQSGRLRCIDGVAALGVRITLDLRGRNADLWRGHADIVALAGGIPTAAGRRPGGTADAAVST